MRIYFSGLGGVGIGPLAQIAQNAGYDVIGSDRETSMMTDQLQRQGMTIHIGDQTGDFLREHHEQQPFDFFVYTASLASNHPELVTARELDIICLKRDGLLARIIADKQLDMIACAGTHGKTTTSGLMVWVFNQLGIPVSYAVGTTLSYGPSGHYDPDSQYFIYECDEYDRNFLHYTPPLSLITSIDYDHPDTYPTLASYQQAFTAFIDQSDHTLMWRRDLHVLDEPNVASDVTVFDDSISLDHLHLAGHHLRQNAFLVERTLMRLFPEISYHDIVSAINSFPGTDRRMERIDNGLYSDYGHHPTEIKATLAAARELSDKVALIYQPHQNIRQHLIQHEYTAELFADADSIYWLPTYQSREDPELPILSPEQLARQLQPSKVHYAQLDNGLWQQINQLRSNGYLVLAMGAGNIDSWLRSQSKGELD